MEFITCFPGTGKHEAVSFVLVIFGHLYSADN